MPTSSVGSRKDLVLATLLVANLSTVVACHREVHRVPSAKSQINTFVTALVAYRGDVGSFPRAELGLQALRVKPDGVSNWQGPYLQKDVPWDPWGHPYLYKYPGEHGDTPDIVSLGADGQPGGEGENADIVSWK